MELVRCMNSESGNIVRYGFQPTELDSRGNLEVEFAGRTSRDGLTKPPSLYRYKRVPQSKWQSLLMAPSAGQFLEREIKPNYECERVR